MAPASQLHNAQTANHCVACGVCLPHCPTYAVSKHEADSPRGRLSLIKGIAEGKLKIDPSCIHHLETCLLCRHCETVCPAEVPFGYIMDQTRRTLLSERRIAPLPIWLSALACWRPLRWGLLLILCLYHYSGLRFLLYKIIVWKGYRAPPWEAALPPQLPLIKRLSPPKSSPPPKIALFSGCIASVLDTQTLNDAIQIIQAAGYDIARPTHLACCGALHQHAGDHEKCQHLLEHNQQALRGFQQLISCASGCGIQLAEQQSELCIVHQDIHQFLARCADQLQFKPLHKTIALHIPCTLQTMSPNDDTISPLLKRIPGLEIKPLAQGCCGGAGTYMLKQADFSNTIFDRMIPYLKDINTNLLLTANIGCAIQFRRGFAKHRLSFEVLHPVTLLARQLQFNHASSKPI